MKKKKFLAFLLTILLISTLAVGLTSCGEKDGGGNVAISRARIVGSDTAFFEDFDLSNLKVELTYTDGSKQITPLTNAMITEESKNSLQFLGDGKKIINATYQGKNVTFTLTMTHNPNLEVLTGFTLDNLTFEYSGDEKNLQVEPNESEGVSITYINNGQIDVGEYTVIAVIRKQGYQALELTNKLVITPKPVNKPLAPKNLIYNKEVQSVNMPVTNYYQTKGETIGKNAGDYAITVSLISRNFVWKEDGTTDDLEFIWTIEKAKIDLSFVEWQADRAEQIYDGNPKIVSLKQYPRTVIPKYSGTKQATEAGEYVCYVSYEVQDPLNYEIDDKPYVSFFNWKIFRNRFNTDINDPNSTRLESQTIVYDGQPHMIEVKNLVPGAKVAYNTSGVTNYKKDPYIIKATVSKEGYETITLVANITILKKEIIIPEVTNHTCYYTGMEHTVKLSNTEGILIKGIKCGIEPNKFSISFSLEDKANCIWSDNTSADISNSNTWWEISRIPLNNELVKWNYDVATPFVFSGGNNQVLLSAEGMNGIDVIYDNNENVNAGTYTTKATIKMLFDKDKYIGYDSFKRDYQLTWEVKPLVIDFSNPDIKWDYNTQFIENETGKGQIHKVSLLGLPDEIYLNILDDNGILPITYTQAEFNAQGTYVASFSLNNNFEAKNATTSGKRTIQWKIIRNEMLGIIVNDKTTVYDGALQEINVEGIPVNATYIKESYTDVGIYPINVKITKQGYSAYEKEVNLTIKPQPIAKPTVTNSSVYFNGKELSCGIKLNDLYTVTGSADAVTANTYFINVSLVDNKNYVWADNSADDFILNWEIKKLNFDSSNIQWNYDPTMPLTFNGSAQGVELLNIPDGIKITYVTTLEGREVNQVLNTGTYITSAKLELMADDSCYENPNDIRNYRISPITWNITPKEIDMQFVKWNSTCLLYDKGKELSVTLENLPEEIAKLFTYDKGSTGTETGKYTATATFNNENNNYKLINKNYSDTLEWNIIRNELDWVTFNDKTVEYTGDFVKPELTFAEGVDQATKEIINGVVEFTCGGATQDYKDAGTYTIKATINVREQLNYEEKELNATYIITPKKVIRPTITLPVNLVYDGTEKKCTISPEMDMTYCKIKNDRGTSAGDYTLTISFKDETKFNYIWVDDVQGTNPSYQDVTKKWTIKPKQIIRPTITLPNNLVYDGTEKQCTIKFTNKIDKTYCIIKNDRGTTAGEYTLTIALINHNYIWVDNLVGDNPGYLDKEEPWTIKKQEIEKPILNVSEFTYDGQSHYPIVAANYKYTIVGKAEIEVGNYTINVILKDKKNYVWKDGTTEPFSLYWTIKKQEVEKPTLNVSEFTYDGQSHYPNVTANYKYTLVGKAEIEVGNYTINVILKDKKNYVWKDGTAEPIILEWSIKPIEIQKPTLDVSGFTYDGQSHYPNVTANDKYTVVGKGETEVGNYTINVILNDKVHCTWGDGTSGDLLISWSINV